MNESLEPLLGRARKGDRDAFEGLVRRFLPSVHAIVRRTSKGRGVPEELVRETFDRAWRGLAGLSEKTEFDRWLGGIARYVAVEAARLRVPFAVARQKSEPDVASDRVFGAVASLSAEERDAVLARHLDGLSRAAAAAALDIDVETLDARLLSGREALAARLSPVEPS